MTDTIKDIIQFLFPGFQVVLMLGRDLTSWLQGSALPAKSVGVSYNGFSNSLTYESGVNEFSHNYSIYLKNMNPGELLNSIEYALERLDNEFTYNGRSYAIKLLEGVMDNWAGVDVFEMRLEVK